MANTRNLNDMMLFMALIDAGSFTLAADRLNMPKANLSRKIARLEEQLGVTLLERTTRTQHITEAGRTYLAHCRRIHQEVDLADAAIAQILNKVEGCLRIGASVGIGHEILKSELARFMHQHPKVNIELSLTNRRVDLIEEAFDMVIRIGQLDDSRLIAKRLGSISRRLYASPGYLEQIGGIDSHNALDGCDFLVMKSAHSDRHFQLQSGKQIQHFDIEPKLLIDDFSVLKQMLIDGLGLAIMPDYMCKEEVEQGNLRQVLPKWVLPSVDIFALYPKNRLNIPKVKAFMDFIEPIFHDRLSN